MASSNLILSADSYKYSHWAQTPPGVTGAFHYFYSRGGQFPYTVWFGLQEKLLSRFNRPIFTVDVLEAQEFVDAHMGPGIFYRAGWDHIVRDHNGYMPMRIKAVPEGTVVPTHNALMTVENTCPQCYWVPAFFETQLSHPWYGTTVCTLSHQILQLIRRFLIMTEGNADGLEFKLHDFGFRGVSSDQSAGIGGAAHLVNSRGSDNVQGILTARDIYGAKMAGLSIPAAEHYTITSWGEDNEVGAYSHMLDTFPGTVAVVSDSYDIVNACSNIWGGVLRDKVLARKGMVVIRPDSGEPVEDVVLQVMEALGQKLPCQVNSLGYRRLPDQVRVIQGDGINYHTIDQILLALVRKQWSAANVNYGMGGALLQQVNRDTLRFKYAASAIQRDGVWQPISKHPKGAPWKASIGGRLKLVKDGNSYKTVTEDQPGNNELITVFEDGNIQQDLFTNIQRRAAANA